MNARQRRAENDMKYLAAAWRAGFDGPSATPKGTSMWAQMVEQIRNLPRQFDEERVMELHTRWRVLNDRNEYQATVLLWYYRDNWTKFDDREVLAALDGFALT